MTRKEFHLFQRMMSDKAVSVASLYLKHEEKILTDVLRNTEGVENVVVVGAGPFIHLDTILAHQKNYIGIDPCLYDSAISCNKIMAFDSLFESVDRDQLPEGKSIFIFCFNVLFYLDHPEDHINRVLKRGDIVIMSQWSSTEYAVSLMNKYFHHVYKKEKVDLNEIVSNILRFKISLSTLKLSRIEKVESEINSIIVGYFE